MLPEELKRIDERVLQLVECRENAIGEGLAQTPEDLRSLIELGAAAWQIEGMHAPWPAHLATVMTARTVEHDSKRTFAQLVAQMPQKELQALAIHVGQQQKDTGARGGFDRRRQVFRPKRPSSKATTRESFGCVIRLAKFF